MERDKQNLFWIAAIFVIGAVGSIWLYKLSLVRVIDPGLRSALAILSLDESSDISCIGACTCTYQDTAMVWYCTSNSDNDKTYYPLECDITRGYKFYLKERHDAIESNIEGVVYTVWGDGYAVVVDNENCIGIEVTADDGSISNIDLSKHDTPYMGYFDDISKCQFLII